MYFLFVFDLIELCDSYVSRRHLRRVFALLPRVIAEQLPDPDLDPES